MEKEPEKRRKKNSIRKRALTSNGVRNIEENIIINQVLKNEDFLGKQFIVMQEKTTVNAAHAEK